MSDQAVQLSPETISDTAQQFRSQVGHISRNSGVFFAGTIFTAALSYVFKVYLAHVLGAQDLGLYALGATLVGFLGIFNSLGLPQSAVRFVAEYQASGKFKELHALLWRGAALLLAANLVFAAVLLTFGKWIAVHFYHAPALVKYLPLFALMMLIGVGTTFYGKVLAGYRDLKVRTLIVNFIGSPLNMLLAVLLIWLGLGLRGYLVAQVLSAAVVFVLLISAVRHLTPLASRFSARTGELPRKEIWSFSSVMLGVGCLEFLMSQVDRIALGFYRSPKEVGIYSIAAALVAYVPIALISVNQIFAPTIANLYTRGDHALLARLFQSLTKWVIGLTLPGAVVALVFAHPLMSIFGRDFEVGWPILMIGTAAQLINCAVGSVGYLLLMSGNEKRLMKVQIAMATAMVVGSAVLVPFWGIYGAAIAAALVNIGTNVWNLLEVRQALGILPYNRSYFHLAIPALVTVAIVAALRRYAFIFHHNWLSVGVALTVAYCLFPAVFYFISGLDEDDRLIASALMARMRGAFAPRGAEA